MIFEERWRLYTLDKHNTDSFLKIACFYVSQKKECHTGLDQHEGE